MATEAASWQAIRSEVLDRLRRRDWEPGDFLPHDDELAREFGCARATVSRALRDLAETGLLDRRRKAGTRVAVNPVRKATLEIPIIRQEIEQRGRRYGYALITREEAPAPLDVRSVLGLGAGAVLLHVKALHLADDAPWCIEDRWINPQAVPDILNVDLSAISANQWLVQNTPYSHGTLILSAALADAETAPALRCAVGAAVFVIERATYLHDQPITFLRQTHPGTHRMTTSV
jgi:GntR family histidine utilization transcriptional repressor